MSGFERVFYAGASFGVGFFQGAQSGGPAVWQEALAQGVVFGACMALAVYVTSRLGLHRKAGAA